MKGFGRHRQIRHAVVHLKRKVQSSIMTGLKLSMQSVPFQLIDTYLRSFITTTHAAPNDQNLY